MDYFFQEHGFFFSRTQILFKNVEVLAAHMIWKGKAWVNLRNTPLN
jgi:hypothetical protein